VTTYRESYEGETIERAAETLLQDNIGDALDAVEARWVSIDALTLAEPANWGRGYRAFMLELPSTYYPYVLTIVERFEPEGQAGRRSAQNAAYQLVYTAWVVADTEADVVDIAHRYGEAIVDVLQDSPEIAGRMQRNQKPAVRIYADNVVHLKAGVSGDAQSTDDVDYLRMVEITQFLED